MNVIWGFLAVLAFLVALISASVWAEGEEHPYSDQKYEIQNPAYNVPTSAGLKNFSEKTLVGGNNATNFIRLTLPTNFSTPLGNFTFPSETQIDCNVPPGYPNPCNPYGG